MSMDPDWTGSTGTLGCESTGAGVFGEGALIDGIGDLGIEFEVRLKPVIEEYPNRLTNFEIRNDYAQHNVSAILCAMVFL